MRRSLSVYCLLSCMVFAAAAPAAAGPPVRAVYPLSGLPLECEGRTVTFTSGDFVGTEHEHEGRRGGTQSVFTYRLRDARLTTEDGQTLRAVGSASNSSVYRGTDGAQTEIGTFVANFTLIAANKTSCYW